MSARLDRARRRIENGAVDVAAAILTPPLEAKPFVKWVGGKRQLLTAIDQTIVKHLTPKPGGTYHEPFVGGGAVFFHRQPARAFLTDSNARLIRTYRGIQGDVERVIAQLRKFEKQHDKDFYLELRAQNIDSSKKDADVAAWFIYLNRTGYNGLYRVNSKNGFNVPFGDYKKPMICDEDNLRACSEALEGARIENTDFTAVLKRAKKGDFVYFDPPYIPLTATSRFTDYTSEGFSDAEQVKLRDVALELKGRGVSVLLSNSSAPRVYDLYAKGFECCEVLARRSVNSDPTGRGRIPELLIY